MIFSYLKRERNKILRIRFYSFYIYEAVTLILSEGVLFVYKK